MDLLTRKDLVLDWLRKRLRRTDIRPMPISFALDRSPEGQHIVQIIKRIDGLEEFVTNPKDFWRYGYQEEVDSVDGPIVIYVIDEPDRQTLLSLRSMNPNFLENGRLAFDFAPPILNYIRSKNNISETEFSGRLQISNKPLEPKARVNYDPNEGLIIETGYEIEGQKDLVPAQDLPTTTVGNYLLIGDTFTPLPKKLGKKAQNWLKQSQHVLKRSEIPEFFERDFVLLQSQFSAVLTDLASQIQIIEEPLQPFVRVDKGEPGWLDFDVGYEVGNTQLPHDLLINAVDQAYIPVDEFTWVKNDPKLVKETDKKLRQLESEISDQGYRAPASEFVSLEEFIKSVGGRPELSAAYQEFLAQLTGFAADENFRLSRRAEKQLTNCEVTLRPYQRAGIHWLSWLYDNQLHGLLADDMGLGKTLQAISVLRRAYEKSWSRQPSLVLAPYSVLHHWEREFNRFYPDMRIYRYHGPKRKSNLFRALEPIVFISTYSTAANDIEILKKVPFYYLVLDEATRIKNPTAKRTKAVKAMNAGFRLALSGTPVENRPAEIWSIFDFLMRSHLGKYGTFVRTFEERISAGDKSASKRLGRRIRPFLLRRMKEDVEKDLPEKIEMDEWCRLTEEQRQLYGAVQGETRRMRTAIQRGERVNYTSSILPVLVKLKQICDHPAIVSKQMEPVNGRSQKFDWIIDKIKQIQQEGDQVVVFSHFLGMLSLLQKGLPRSFKHVRIDGSTRNRQQLIDRFNDGQATIALCSLMAVGHGVNLTAGNHVIHCDRWWNPAVEDQATDRVHRIGQNKTVYVHRIMVEGTLEERIETLLNRKRGMADEIISAATSADRRWTREELMELLRPLD